MMNYTWPEILLWDFLWEVTNYSFIFQFFFKEWRTLEHGWSFTFRLNILIKIGFITLFFSLEVMNLLREGDFDEC